MAWDPGSGICFPLSEVVDSDTNSQVIGAPHVSSLLSRGKCIVANRRCLRLPNMGEHSEDR